MGPIQCAVDLQSDETMLSRRKEHILTEDTSDALDDGGVDQAFAIQPTPEAEGDVDAIDIQVDFHPVIFHAIVAVEWAIAFLFFLQEMICRMIVNVVAQGVVDPMLDLSHTRVRAS